MSIAAKTRENTESVTREHKFLSGNRGNLCVKILRRDSTPPVRDKTRVDTRDEERDYKGLRRAQVALSVWLARQPRRCPGETNVRGLIVV